MLALSRLFLPHPPLSLSPSVCFLVFNTIHFTWFVIVSSLLWRISTTTTERNGRQVVDGHNENHNVSADAAASAFKTILIFAFVCFSPSTHSCLLVMYVARRNWEIFQRWWGNIGDAVMWNAHRSKCFSFFFLVSLHANQHVFVYLCVCIMFARVKAALGPSNAQFHLPCHFFFKHFPDCAKQNATNWRQ